MKRQRGFTLTDILVTVFIIAALISIALPILGNMQRSAEASRKKADLNAVTVALESFKSKNGDYPRMNLQTVRRLMKNATEAQIQAAYHNLLESQTRGSQILTMALLDGGFLGDNFRTVQVLDSTSNRNVKLLATHDDRPILYYPGLPVRLDLSQPEAYVASMGPVQIDALRKSGGVWQLPLFNTWDNGQFLSESTVRTQLKAGADGRAGNTVPEYCGAYLLWAAGDEANLADAYTSQTAVLMAGGGQPLIMIPGGPGAGHGVDAFTAYAAYIPKVGTGWGPDAAYFRPDTTPSTSNPFQYTIGNNMPPGNPPPNWQDHEIPPRTPNTPPGDAINILDNGAKPNDGIDDWQAIKDALDKARKDGKAIVIPDGKFDISRPLDIRNGDKIYGGGTLKVAGGNEFGILIPGGSNGIYIDGITLDGAGINVADKSSNITIINCAISNITHSGSYNNGAAIRANGGLTNSTIEQNHFTNIRQEGVWINTTADKTSVSNNYFDHAWQSIHVISNSNATGIKLNGNYGVGMTRMGIEFQGDRAVGSEIIGNTFKDWKQDAVYHGSFALSIYNMGGGTKIVDNMLSGFGNNPVGIEMGGPNDLAQGNVVTGFREGMHVIHADNSVVTGNTFTGQTWMSIWFPGYGSARNVRVTGNEFDLSAEAAILFMGGGWDGTTIEGNKAKLGGNTQFIKSHSGTGGLNIGSNQITH